jgi:hypothetical protein
MSSNWAWLRIGSTSGPTSRAIDHEHHPARSIGSAISVTGQREQFASTGPTRLIILKQLEAVGFQITPEEIDPGR